MAGVQFRRKPHLSEGLNRLRHPQYVRVNGFTEKPLARYAKPLFIDLSKPRAEIAVGSEKYVLPMIGEERQHNTILTGITQPLH